MWVTNSRTVLLLPLLLLSRNVFPCACSLPPPPPPARPAPHPHPCFAVLFSFRISSARPFAGYGLPRLLSSSHRPVCRRISVVVS